MTEIWAGDIIGDDLPGKIQDVHFWNDSEISYTLIATDATLRFLSNVHVPSIPHYLAVGPSLEVSTENTETATWLSHNLNVESDHNLGLSSGNSSRSDALRQLKIGILVGVEAKGSKSKVTEILLYAQVQREEPSLPFLSQCSTSMLSETAQPKFGTDSHTLVKVYALPLCSDILVQAKSISGCLKLNEANYTIPIFLADHKVEDSALQKRQKLSGLFDDATQQRRKLKGRGGEGISKAMSHADDGLSQQILVQNCSKEASVCAPKSARKTFSGPSSGIVLSNATETRQASQGALANVKRSTLHRIDSTMSSWEASTVSESDTSVALQNKAALTKMVMAGMRLHGLQQKRKRRFTSDMLTAPENVPSLRETDVLTNGDDEYKLVYHQAFKAAMFIFRADFSERPISQEAMRDVVDRLLVLFCTNPTTTGSQAPGNSQQDTLNAFDLPSRSATCEGPTGDFSTPATKKRC